MIPRAHITAWRAHAPWATDAQVEQDLVISRALVEIFSDAALAAAFAFRGGTALHKIFFQPAARYSEDIDLVQIAAEPIGPALDALRARLDPWLGTPQRTRGEGRVTLAYRFEAEGLPVTRLRLKVEINTREHFAVHGHHRRPVRVDNPWFRAAPTSSPSRSRSCLGPSCARSANERRAAISSTLPERFERTRRSSARRSWRASTPT